MPRRSHRLCAPALAAALMTLVVAPSPAAAPAASPSPDSPASRRDAMASQLAGEALLSDQAWRTLRELTDGIGHRMSNSPAMAKAVDWAEATMRGAGLADVHREAALVPNWIRGEERAEIVSPIERPLTMIGLGRSVGTPPGGITAPIVIVPSMTALDSLPAERVNGRIVLYDYTWSGYSAGSRIRVRGPSAAGRLGAVASLCRSATPRSLDTPHTGILAYRKEDPTIPGAALSIESTALIHRLVDSGAEVRVHLMMNDSTGDSVESHNVMGEVRGGVKPDEIVLVTAHLDSWDVGQGALDDGAGVAMVLEAARLIARLPSPPRRTIRFLLVTDEENGASGSESYLDRHRAELRNHVAAFESDSGNEPATGFSVCVHQVGVKNGNGGVDSLRTASAAAELARDLVVTLNRDAAPLLAPLGAARFRAGGSGAVTDTLTTQGVLGFGLDMPTESYFDVHHTVADTFDRINSRDLARNTAVLALAAWFVADAPDRLLPWPQVAGASSDR